VGVGGVVRVFGEVLRFGIVAVVSIRDHHERKAEVPVGRVN